jgi:hypothetical protein
MLAPCQTIGNWAFSGVLTGIPGANNTVTIADFSVGSPVHSFNGGTEYFGEGGWPAGGLNPAVYFQFGLAPIAGFQLDITSVVLRIRRSNTGTPAGSGPVSWSLRSSIDGFATDIASGSMTHNYANYTIAPGSAFLNVYTPVTFRLYGYNMSTGSGGTSRLVIDNISVDGITNVLPLLFTSFMALPRDNKIVLQFSLSNTIAGARYFVERSADGGNFSILHEIGETGAFAERQYTYADNNVPANTIKLFYRIRAVNTTGRIIYSAVVPVLLQNTARQSLRAIMHDHHLYVSAVFALAGNTEVNLYALTGQRMVHVNYKTSNGYQVLAIPVEQLPAGTYVVNVINGVGQMSCLVVNGQ